MSETQLRVLEVERFFIMKFILAAFADEADCSIEKQIDALRENGISYLEIRGVDGENVSNISAAKAKEVRAKLEASGISVRSIGSPYGKIKIEEDFAPHLDRFKYGLETAQILGAKNMRIFSFYLPPKEADRYADTVLERLDRFRCAAKDSGITLCHENEKGIYGDTAARCLHIHRSFPDIKAVFDPANFVQCGQDTRKAWELLCGYVEYMHIKDALADGTVVPAGQGLGNIPYLLAQYQGEVLTLEPHLAVFGGLEGLEAAKSSKIGAFCYPSKRAAFDAATAALKKIIEESGNSYGTN